jgi:hypothetical protein
MIHIVGDFLRAHEGARFCFPCLAEMLGAPEADVMSAVDRLRMSAGIEVESSRCGNCSQARAVARVAPQT